MLNEDSYKLQIEESKKLIHAKNYRAAEKMLLDLQASYPQGIETASVLGFVYMLLGDFDRADRITQDGINKNPEYLKNYVVNADSAMWQKDFNEGLRRSKNICERFPDHWEGYDRLAWAYINLDQYDLAEATCLELMKMAPKLAQGYIKYADAAMRRHDYQTALERWQKVIQEFPKDALGYGKSIYIYDLVLNDRRNAELTCEAALAQSPGNKNFHLKYLDIALHNDDCKEADARLQKIMAEFYPDSIDDSGILLLERVNNFYKDIGGRSGINLSPYVNNLKIIAGRLYKKYCDGIIKDHGLIKNEKIALLTSAPNVGDCFYCISALNYVEKKLKRQYCFITKENSPGHDIIKLFQKSDIHVNAIFINISLEKLYYLAKEEIRNLYKGLIEDSYATENRIFFNMSPYADVKENLEQIKIEKIVNDENRQYYIDKYGIIPGRTVFMIPEAKWHQCLPDFFWEMAAEFYGFLGFKILINSKQPGKYGKRAHYIFPPVADVIPITEICGNLLAIRTGIAELAAAASYANATIISHFKESILNWYTYIDNSDNHLREYFIDNIRTTGFDALDKFIQYLLKPYSGNRSGYYSMIDGMRNAVMQTYVSHDQYPIFMNHPNKRLIQDFCSASYGQRYANGRLYMNFAIEPNLDYVIHIGLRNITANRIEQEMRYCKNNAVSFKIENDGLYNIFVRIYHPIEKICAHFQTEPVAVRPTWQERIANCRNFNDYLDLLNRHLDDIIIFAAFMGAPSCGEGKKELDLAKINLGSKKSPQDHFLAIIDSGKVAYEKNNATPQLSHVLRWGANEASLSVTSQDAKNDNRPAVSIKINGAECAVNLRGINFVIWDKKSHRTIDTAAFDVHGMECQVHRLNPALKM